MKQKVHDPHHLIKCSWPSLWKIQKVHDPHCPKSEKFVTLPVFFRSPPRALNNDRSPGGGDSLFESHRYAPQDWPTILTFLGSTSDLYDPWFWHFRSLWPQFFRFWAKFAQNFREQFALQLQFMTQALWSACFTFPSALFILKCQSFKVQIYS